MENMADVIGLTSGINASNASNLINAKSLIALNTTFSNTKSSIEIETFNSAIILIESCHPSSASTAMSRGGVGMCIVPNMTETLMTICGSNSLWGTSSIYFTTSSNSIEFYHKLSTNTSGYLNGIIAILS